MPFSLFHSDAFHHTLLLTDMADTVVTYTQSKAVVGEELETSPIDSAAALEYSMAVVLVIAFSL